jgi:general secretion pathway protein A
MYQEFYGLREKPFSTTPDPKFLYLTVAHQEALAQILYGVRERKGFIVLTGQVGTGKTTLLHTLRQRLNGQAAVSFVFSSTLAFEDILEYVLEDLGVAKGPASPAQRLMALNNFLIDRQRIGENTVLMFDEAQNMAPGTLEQIRLLSNFETPTDKLLQILLVGQPELKEKLQLPELHQLKQRIGLRCHIPPLTAREARHYIRNRLWIAGADDLDVFTESAVGRIAEYSGGIPRLMNIVCDHCLLFGYADQKRRVEESTVKQAIEYLEEGMAPCRPAGTAGGLRTRLASRWGLGTLVLALAVVGASLAMRFDMTLLEVVRSMRDLLVR